MARRKEPSPDKISCDGHSVLTDRMFPAVWSEM